MFGLKYKNIFIVFMLLASSLAFYFIFPGRVLAVPISDEEVEIEAKINELENKIAKYREGTIANKQKAKSLQTEIDILDGEVAKSELEIEKIDLVIKDLDYKIHQKELSVQQNEKNVILQKLVLAELLREINKNDEVSVAEVILAKGRFSDLMVELNSLQSFQNQLQEIFNKIDALKSDVEKETEALSEQKEEQLALRDIQNEQKNSLEKSKEDKKTLLEQTKGQEGLFSQLVQRTQEDVNGIKGRLYFLRGMVDGDSLKFEDAYQFAEFASNYTGVRPAFLLAILSRESELGKNVGTGTWRSDMKPSQRSYYLQICKKLGLNPDNQTVSRKTWYGWGGALGPAQFLPATWLGYEKKISEISGNNPVSPWNIKDAFVAAGLYLADKGATNSDYDAEWKAAMMFLAGSKWNQSSLFFYGDQVMDLAKQIQGQIDILKKG